MVTTRASIRAIYRQIALLDGWVSTGEIARAAIRLTYAPAGYWDRRSDIRVADRTRRTVTLAAV